MGINSGFKGLTSVLGYSKQPTSRAVRLTPGK